MISVRKAPFAVYTHQDPHRPLDVHDIIQEVQGMVNGAKILVPLVIDVPANRDAENFIHTNPMELRQVLRDHNILLVGWKIDDSWGLAIQDYIKNLDMIVFSSMEATPQPVEAHSSWIHLGEIEIGNAKEAIIHRELLRSGQVLSGSDVVVLGHVNSGSYVHSSGNVRIAGKCAGSVSAGESDNHQAFIWCENFMASLVSIAGYYQNEFPEGVQGKSVLITLDENHNIIWSTRKKDVEAIKAEVDALVGLETEPA